MTAAVATDAGPSLATLTETVNREHALAMQAARGMLQHAIAAGVALLEIQPQVPEGQWRVWVEANVEVAWTTANDYMRVAHFRDRLDGMKVTGLEEALTILRGLARNPARPGSAGLPDLRLEALRMHRAGSSQGEICSALKVSKTSVYWWTHPKEHRAHLRKLRSRNEEAKSLREQHTARALAKAVRKNGAALAELYAAAERMQDVFGQAEREEQDPDARRHLALAGQHYRRMRDEVATALGTSRTTEDAA